MHAYINNNNNNNTIFNPLISIYGSWLYCLYANCNQKKKFKKETINKGIKNDFIKRMKI